MIDLGLGAPDLIDLATKCVIVVALLLITLRVLGRLQSAGPRRAGRLQVLESRSLAAKASLHLVAVGDRRLVVGLTPNGMVSLAELKAEDLEAADFAAELATQEAARDALARPRDVTGSAPLTLRSLLAAGSRLNASNALNAILAPVDALAGRLAGLLGGGAVK